VCRKPSKLWASQFRDPPSRHILWLISHNDAVAGNPLFNRLALMQQHCQVPTGRRQLDTSS